MENHNLNKFKQYFNKLHDGIRKWRIAIYVRLSKEDGKSISLSIENQIKSAARFLRDFEDFEIVDIYVDDGKTGTDFDRADYIRLQGDVENKIVNCIIVMDLTRYSRNLADGIKELDNFVLVHKLRFISVRIPELDTFKDPKQISSPEVYQALQSAEDYARITSIKVRSIKEQKREDGEKNGGFPPYGYLPNPDGQHWIYDEYAGEIVKKIFLWSANGMSNRKIAKELNAQGILNPTAYKKSLGMKFHTPFTENNSGLWWPTVIGHILTDKTYIGYSVQGKSSSFDHKRHKQIQKPKEEYIIVPDCHEKTVSIELFEKVAQNKAQRTRSTKKGEAHLFANLVYCSNCKRGMTKNRTNTNDYLVCRTHHTLGKEYCNSKNSINYKKLEEKIFKLIQAQINTVIDMSAIVEQINKKSSTQNQSLRLEQLIRNISQEIKKAEHIFDTSYYDWKNEEISKEQYQRIRKETEQKLEQLNNSLRDIARQQQSIKNGIKSNNEFFERFLKYRTIDKLDRLMVVELINKIYINDDKSVKIEFNYNDQYLLILDYIKQNQTNQTKEKVKKIEKK